MRASRNSFIAFAAAPDHVALDSLPGSVHSPFTQSLLAYLDAVDLPLSSLTSRVRQDVLKITADKQTTWDNSSLLESFYFNSGSIFVFMALYLSVLGLILSTAISTLVAASKFPSTGWMLGSATLLVASVAVLFFSMNALYARLHGHYESELDGTDHRHHVRACLRKGLAGGFLGSLVAAGPLSISYYLQWRAPQLSLAQLLLVAVFAAAFATCPLGFAAMYFSRVSFVAGRPVVLRQPSNLRILFGALTGGALVGLCNLTISYCCTWSF